MTKVQALEEEIGKLSAAELAELREWFAERDAEEWDREIEQDAASGKLDKLFEKTTERDTSESNQKGSGDSALLALYSENGNVARAMMEWRYRVITLYVLTLGGVGSSFLWLNQHHVLHGLTLTFFLAALIVCLLLLMESTNAAILWGCYRVGDLIEHGVAHSDGIYSVMLARRESKRTFTYTRILRGLFVGTIVAFIGAGLFFL